METKGYVYVKRERVRSNAGSKKHEGCKTGESENWVAGVEWVGYQLIFAVAHAGAARALIFPGRRCPMRALAELA